MEPPERIVKRLAALLFVFNFGITRTPLFDVAGRPAHRPELELPATLVVTYLVFLSLLFLSSRRQDHYHLAPFEPGERFDLTERLQVGLDPFQHFQSRLLVRHLRPA